MVVHSAVKDTTADSFNRCRKALSMMQGGSIANTSWKSTQASSGDAFTTAPSVTPASPALLRPPTKERRLITPSAMPDDEKAIE